jgi:hypothetical protein
VDEAAAEMAREGRREGEDELPKEEGDADDGSERVVEEEDAIAPAGGRSGALPGPHQRRQQKLEERIAQRPVT